MYSLDRYEPLVGRLDGLFNELLRPAQAHEGSREEAALIRFDVRETAEATIDRRPKDGEKWLRAERFSGKAARRFALPQEVDEAKSQARFEGGVLELTLPKKAQVTGRKLSIQ